MPNELQGLLGGMQATPRNKLMGLLADGLKAADRYANKPDPTMPGGKANPPLSLLSDLASLKSLAEVANNVSYGYPLTNKGVANVPFLKPETADSLMTLAPMTGNALRGAEKVATKGSNALVRAITGNPEATGQRVIDYARAMVPANPATVWHSSPYKFDKFDAGKAGTGEGNASFGVGTYLAESPEVSGVGGKYFDQFKRHPAVKETGGPFAYAVDLPDDAIGKMFDWDKPLKAQPPAVREAITSLARSDEQLMDAIKANGFGDMRGDLLYAVLQDSHTKNAKRAAVLAGADATKFTHDDLAKFASGNNEFATDKLRGVGIPGIRYLDGGSRGAGQGSSNFVVFPGNEGLLSILERNGQPLR